MVVLSAKSYATIFYFISSIIWEGEIKRRDCITKKGLKYEHEAFGERNAIDGWFKFSKQD